MGVGWDIILRTGKKIKMREQGGGEGENDGVREGKARKHGGEQGRKKRFAGTGTAGRRLICERISKLVLTNLLTNSGE